MSSRPITRETVPLERFAESMRHAAVNLGCEALSRYGVVPPEVSQVLSASDNDLRVIQLREAWTHADIDRWIDRQLDALRS